MIQRRYAVIGGRADLLNAAEVMRHIIGGGIGDFARFIPRRVIYPIYDVAVIKRYTLGHIVVETRDRFGEGRYAVFFWGGYNVAEYHSVHTPQYLVIF